MPTKLHEILAVSTALSNQSTKVSTDLKETFAKKRHLFEQRRAVFTPNAENAAPVTEAQSDIQTSVVKELRWLSTYLTKSYDADFHIALANTTATADVILEDGTTLLAEVPATALLDLEKRLTEFRSVLETVGTLDPAKGFAPDNTFPEGTFKARPVVKTRTAKKARPMVKAEATKEHPAQVEVVIEDVPTGTIQEEEWSSLLTPAKKADLLEAVEALTRAVKAARSRANSSEVDTSRKIGKVIFNHLLAPITASAK